MEMIKESNISVNRWTPQKVAVARAEPVFHSARPTKRATKKRACQNTIPPEVTRAEANMRSKCIYQKSLGENPMRLIQCLVICSKYVFVKIAPMIRPAIMTSVNGTYGKERDFDL